MTLAEKAEHAAECAELRTEYNAGFAKTLERAYWRARADEKADEAARAVARAADLQAEADRLTTIEES